MAARPLTFLRPKIRNRFRCSKKSYILFYRNVFVCLIKSIKNTKTEANSEIEKITRKSSGERKIRSPSTMIGLYVICDQFFYEEIQ